MSYDFNQQIADTGQDRDGDSNFLFKNGIRYHYMNPKGESVFRFRLMPAFHRQSVVEGENGHVSISDMYAWEPCRDFAHPNAPMALWGRVVKMARYIGHYTQGAMGSTVDILSPKTFDSEAYCPLTALCDEAKRTSQWSYLVNGRDDGTGNTSKALSKPKDHLLANIMLYEGQTGIPKLGVFSTSGFSALLDKKTGLMNLRNTSMATLEGEARWAAGDVTNVDYGQVLKIYRARGTTRYSSFTIEMDSPWDRPQEVLRVPIPHEALAQRYVLHNLEDLFIIKTDKEIVENLVRVLNGTNDSGEREYELLEHVFGKQYDLPPAPMTRSTRPQVQGANLGNQFAPPGGGQPGMHPFQGGAGGFPGAPPPPTGPGSQQGGFPMAPPPQQGGFMAPPPQQGGFPGAPPPHPGAPPAGNGFPAPQAPAPGQQHGFSNAPPPPSTDSGGFPMGPPVAPPPTAQPPAPAQPPVAVQPPAPTPPPAQPPAQNGAPNMPENSPGSVDTGARAAFMKEVRGASGTPPAENG